MIKYLTSCLCIFIFLSYTGCSATREQMTPLSDKVKSKLLLASQGDLDSMNWLIIMLVEEVEPASDEIFKNYTDYFGNVSSQQFFIELMVDASENESLIANYYTALLSGVGLTVSEVDNKIDKFHAIASNFDVYVSSYKIIDENGCLLSTVKSSPEVIMAFKPMVDRLITDETFNEYLGLLYFTGQGVSQSFENAELWWRKVGTMSRENVKMRINALNSIQSPLCVK